MRDILIDERVWHHLDFKHGRLPAEAKRVLEEYGVWERGGVGAQVRHAKEREEAAKAATAAVAPPKEEDKPAPAASTSPRVSSARPASRIPS